MPDPSEHKITGFRAEGEQDRSAEFKDARGRLVGSVNDWLEDLARMRDSGTPLPDGAEIGSEPRISQTVLGRIAVNANSMITEYRSGVSLTGKVGEEPLVLNAVRKNPKTGSLDVISVTGSDPLARQLAESEYALSYQTEKVADFTMVTDAADASERYFGYGVSGDGAVKRRNVTEAGVHSAAALREAGDVELAIQAFGLLQADFAGQP